LAKPPQAAIAVWVEVRVVADLGSVAVLQLGDRVRKVARRRNGRTIDQERHDQDVAPQRSFHPEAHEVARLVETAYTCLRERPRPDRRGHLRDMKSRVPHPSRLPSWGRPPVGVISGFGRSSPLLPDQEGFSYLNRAAQHLSIRDRCGMI
jgi:hypothetical protein